CKQSSIRVQSDWLSTQRGVMCMLPATADVVIIGGGCMGASTAYQLAQRGVKVVLLEREKFLGAGSTGRNAGGVRYQFSTEVNIRLSIYSLDIISHFEELYG